ncbi:MAG TPA: TonB-dependent receptor [Candidatus Omnitrophota bacterium]|nr:TonB-dependent receptor [Candidatus Omnitrophota bacterium]HPT07490.1 TonB-dependent receptor [Candidatus Omnitrophota bacterium]
MGYELIWLKRVIRGYFLIALFILPAYSSAFSQSDQQLERIVVKKSAAPATVVGTSLSREVITADEIAAKHILTLTDALNCVAGMDVRSRGPSGSQADMSLRGSTYEQVSVSIDGVKIMDPQTGHYNLDIPLTVYDIDRIEVTQESASTHYGAGAFAGSVNIVTKKITPKKMQVQARGGQHALHAESFSASYPDSGLQGRISYDHAQAKAARPNTDFDHTTATAYFSKNFGDALLDSMSGYQKKDYGASTFYSNLFPEEEEHTQTYFIRTGLRVPTMLGELTSNLFWRKHLDTFILRRAIPSAANNHTTHVYGLDTHIERFTRFGVLSSGFVCSRDEINSTNLGKHARLYEGISIGLQKSLTDRIRFEVHNRGDYYQKWGWQDSMNTALRYALIPDRVYAVGSWARGFRVPTFTELYYSDLGNRGNQNLQAEEADTYTAGIDAQQGHWSGGVDVFIRRGRNLIDWTRATNTDLWEATNLGRVDFRGIDGTVKVKPDIGNRFVRLDAVSFSYTYTDADTKASGFLSKYALDIAKNKYILGINQRLFGCEFVWELAYVERYYGEKYCIGNISISRNVRLAGCRVEPFVSVDNFTNARYSEVGGVLQPGRWIQAGAKLEW